LGEALSLVPKYYNYQKNIPTATFVDYNALKARITKNYGDQIDSIEDFDGVKVYLKENDSWFMIRSSGTEKKVRVYVESKVESEAKVLLETAAKVAAQSG
jgi:phosphomannomutase